MLLEPEELGAYDMIVVRGCGVERIRVRILVEMGESVIDAGVVSAAVGVNTQESTNGEAHVSH